jgi:hypothetical protein
VVHTVMTLIVYAAIVVLTACAPRTGESPDQAYDPPEAGWVMVATSPTEVYWVDASGMTRTGNIIRTSIIQNRIGGQFYSGIGRVRSIRSATEYDCRNKKFRVIAIASFMGINSEGRHLYYFPDDLNAPWRPVRPGTYDDRIMQVVCAR